MKARGIKLTTTCFRKLVEGEKCTELVAKRLHCSRCNVDHIVKWISPIMSLGYSDHRSGPDHIVPADHRHLSPTLSHSPCSIDCFLIFLIITFHFPHSLTEWDQFFPHVLVFRFSLNHPDPPEIVIILTILVPVLAPLPLSRTGWIASWQIGATLRGLERTLPTPPTLNSSLYHPTPTKLSRGAAGRYKKIIDSRLSLIWKI